MPDKLLRRLLDAYGGVTLWRNLKDVTVHMDFRGGPLPVGQGLGKIFPAPGVIHVDPVHRIAEFLDDPQPGCRAIPAR